MIKNYLKIAWRHLLRQRSNSIINVAGLSIGMASAILIFLWVNNEFDFDNYHKNSEKIFRIKNYLSINKNDTWIWENSPYLLGDYAKQQIPELENVCRISPVGYGTQYLNIEGEFYGEDACAYVDDQWFNVFDYTFIKGSAAAFNKHPFSLLLSETKAKKYFGNENPIGKTIRIDTINYQVRGVIQDNPVNSSFQFDVLVPLTAKLSNPQNKLYDEEWGNFNFLTFLKLTPSADPKIVAAKLKDIIGKQREQDNLHIALTPLADIRFETDLQSSIIRHSERKVIYIFGALGILLLLIACINYVNLTTAYASLRSKEVSVRKILGAEKKQLLAQFIAEAMLISFVALMVTLCIVYLVLPLFNRFTEIDFTLLIGSPDLWIVIGGTMLLTMLLTSIYPALLLSSFKPLAVFRGVNVLKIKDGTLRRGLVIVQFTVSIILIVGTIVMYSQLKYINKQNAAYNRSQLFSVSIPFKIWVKYKEEQRKSLTLSFKRELLSQGHIMDVSLINAESVIDMQDLSSGSSNDWEGRAEDFTPGIAFFRADTGFKDMLNLQMAEGRWYQTENTNDQHNSVLNETAVREFNISKPVIGQRFVRQGDTGVIVGVVKDFYYKSMHDKIGPVVISPADGNAMTFLIKVPPDGIVEAQQSAEKVWKSFFPEEPFAYKILEEEFDKLYRADNKASTLIWSFSFIAIFISCLGLFGLAAFTAQRRNKEIGIRKVLGASITNIVSLLSKEFIYMVLLSMLLAFPLAWFAMNSWLEKFAYRINIGWWIFLIAAILALTIAIITVSIQAIRAAVANPVDSLKSE